MKKICIATRVGGFWSLEVGKRSADGTELYRRPVAEFQNLIVDTGMDRIGTNDDWLLQCRVGTGTNAPDESDTALQSQVAATTSTTSSTQSAESTPPYFITRSRTWRFSEGAAAGNLTEIGVGWTAGGGGLFSRALILDGNGDPTSVPVQADEFLDATYQFRMYPFDTDVTGQTTITGSGTHDYILRASLVTSTSDGTPSFGAWGVGNTGSTGGSRNTGSTANSVAYSGDIGSITDSPSSQISQFGGAVNLAYSNGDFYRDFNIPLGLTVGNHANGIRSIRTATGMGPYQIEFDPPIMKTSELLLTLNFRHSWARR